MPSIITATTTFTWLGKEMYQNGSGLLIHGLKKKYPGLKIYSSIFKNLEYYIVADTKKKKLDNDFELVKKRYILFEKDTDLFRGESIKIVKVYIYYNGLFYESKVNRIIEDD